MADLKLFFVYLKDYDAIKGLELRLWASERGFRILSVARGEIDTMYVQATNDGMELMKAKFDFISDYKTAEDLKLKIDQ